MANTKVLHILSSYSDNAAEDYEDVIRSGKILPEKLWEESNKAQKTLVYEDEDCQFEYRAHKFGDVDPDFVEFIRNKVQDYDDSKSNNFYIV